MSLSGENWFVAQLKPNALNLACRNLKRQNFRIFVPTRSERAVRPSRVVNRAKPLFPGYVFLQFDPEQPGWQAVNATRGVTRLILNDHRHPTPLPREFVAGLMARCDKDGLLTAPTEMLNEGDEIRVIAGPFADVVARIEKLDKDSRLQVLLDLMGQKVRTTLPRTDVTRR